ncbi:histidine phosphatase family protein [Paenibacillus sp. MY03]|uniref:histidine phosphatase family protein n=1 Tax=Paenibacillus sp. MY03 TaxID=302980 RepID=UPI00211AECE9|nr:histidine phosphatase family protein [Paenibacillus sp. MY03]
MQLPKTKSKCLEVIALKRFFLIRHCKAEGQEANAKLTIEGNEQAIKLADFLHEKQIDYIISSSYVRAVSSIQPLAEKNKLKINIEERLCERVLSSENIENWMDRLSETYENLDLRLFGGESSREAMERGYSVINELSERIESSVAIVTHGNLMSLIIKCFDNEFGFEEWKKLSNPDVYELKILNSKKEHYSLSRIWK